MAAPAPTRLEDQLPAVFRERDPEKGSFLTRFLEAFGTVFDGVQAEAALVPTLFGVDPTPRLRAGTAVGATRIELDSGAGLCAGDAVQIEDVSHPVGNEAQVEFATIAELEGRAPPGELTSLLPTIAPYAARLEAPLRYEHVEAAPVRRLGLPTGSAPLVRVGVVEVPGPRLQELTLASPEALGAAAGDVVAIGKEAVEHAQVVATHGSVLVVTPPLVGVPPLETPVALLESLPTTTPAPALEHAERTGRELVLAAPAVAGADRLELDSPTGLFAGDVLELRERDTTQSELVRVAELPAGDAPSRGALTAALRIAPRLRFGHPAGTEVAVVDPAGRPTALADDLTQGTSEARVADPAALAVQPGDAVRIGEGKDADYAHVGSVSGDGLKFDPPVARGHARDETVTRLATRSGGTGFLAWLASAVGLELRPDRGERWNRELLRLVGPLWRWRGTRRGVEELLAGYVRGEVGPRELPGGLMRPGVEVLDLANPMQLGFVSTLGYDTVLCGRPNFFRVVLDAERRSPRMHQPAGIEELVRAARQALRREKPAHTYYDIHLHANTMQLGLDSENEVGARLGDTTLLWEEPLVAAGDEERRV